jgi:hypothetical protein
VPDHGRVAGVIELDKSECRPSDVQGMTIVPVNITIMINSGDNFLSLPLYADGRLYAVSN